MTSFSTAAWPQVLPTHRAAAISIGGVSLAVTSERWADISLSAELEPFRIEVRPSDIHIQAEWVAHLSSPTSPQLFDSGCTWRLYEKEDGFQFDFHIPALGAQPYKRLLTDPSFSVSVLQMNEDSFADRGGIGPSPLTYPLDELLITHRLTQEKAIELHGAGIVRRDGTGNLFIGHSGAGKSTVTRLWTESDEVEVLSDDRIIVRRDEQQIPQYAPNNCHRYLQNDAPKYKMRMYGTPWHGEAMFASPNSAPLTRIFVLEHGHGNVVTPLSPSQAVAELFARSFVPFHRHEYVESALVFLEELANAVPVYRYAFEPDHRAVEKIFQFHD